MSRTRILVVLVALALGAVILLARGELPGGSGGDPADRGDHAGGSAASGSKAAGAGKVLGEGTEQRSDDETHVIPEDETTGKSAGDAGLPGLASPRKGPLVELPLPRTASRRGGMVAGLPDGVLDPVPGSRVRSSSVSSAGRALQVGVVATAPGAEATVARFYRDALGRLGFRESRVAAVGGSTAMAFKRGRDSVVITTTPREKRGSDYSVLGLLHAGKR